MNDDELFNKLSDQNLMIDSNFKSELKNKLFKEDEMFGNNKLSLRELIKQNSFKYVSAGFFTAFIVVGAFSVRANSTNSARLSSIKDNIEIPANLEGVLSVDEIISLATSDIPTGQSIVGIELEFEDGTVVYKVKFSDGSFRLYDAKTGAAFVDSDNIETDESVPAGFVPAISVQQARDTASNERPGMTIVKIELEVEEGRVVYSVRFSDDGRVDVDATTGDIVRVRLGDDDSTSDDNSGTSSDDSESDGDSDSDDVDSVDEVDDSGQDNSGSGSDSSGSNDD